MEEGLVIMNDGVIATIKLSDSVSIVIEYEGDLIKLFEKIDDVWKSYNKVFDSRYPDNSILNRIRKKVW